MKYISLTFLVSLICLTAGSQTTYTFIGNGYWTNASNWQSQLTPPDTLPAGSVINIAPVSGDSCVLNKAEVIAAGGSLNIQPGSNFIILNGILITGAVPSLSTVSPSAVFGNYAFSGGNISSDGGSPIIAKGVAWDTVSGPQILTGAITTDGNGNTNYGSYLRNLLPNTQYYLRAYATNSAGTGYGNEVSFTTTTDILPVVSIRGVDTVRATTASAVADILSDLPSITVHGFCWDTARLPTIAFLTKTVYGPPFYPSVWSQLSSLLPKTTYYIRAYATNTFGTAYSNEYSFTTDSLKIPSVGTYALAGNIDALGVVDGSVSAGGSASTNGLPITARGICWDSIPNPTIELSDTILAGSGAGTFSGILTNLRSNTTYYIRPFAIDSVGIGYGPAVTIRSWMPANLDVVTYRNGDSIPQVTDSATWANLTTGAWCYYNNDSSNNAVYGKLYNAYALNDPRGLAPAGWRLPSEDDWNALVYILGNANGTAGGKMKTTTLWMAPNTGASNSSRFSGLPGGLRLAAGSFAASAGYYGDFWSDYRFGYQFGRRLSYNSNGLTQTYTNVNITDYMRNGKSVRCIKE